MKTDIRLIQQKNGMFLYVDCPSGLFQHHLSMNQNGALEFAFLKMWLLYHCRPVFESMPVNEIHFEVTEGAGERWKKPIEAVCAELEQTNTMVAKHYSKRNIADKWTRKLFVNVSDDMRYGSLYRVVREKYPDTEYMDIDLGFDREKREWRKKKPRDVNSLIEYLLKNEIKTIVTVNQYFLDSYRIESSVNLVPLFKHFGMRLITIDNDPHDLRPGGYLYKSAYNNLAWPRFSNLYCLSEYWDKKLSNSNVIPCAIPQDYRNEEEKPLRDDYKIVVLSNSRYDSVNKWTDQINGFMNNLKNPYTDLIKWYMATRRVIIGSDIIEFDRFSRNSMLHQFFWLCAQELKYRAIKALKTNRKVEVYGDIGWNNVCPEYYKGSLNNEQIEKLFMRDDIMFLLINCSYTYLDASGPVYDMIRRGVHWINVPPAVKTKTFGGFEAIEYRNEDELNRLVNDVKPAFKNAQNAISAYRLNLASSVNEIVDGIGGKTYEHSMWRGHCAEHDRCLDEMLEEYSRENETLIRESLRLFG